MSIKERVLNFLKNPYNLAFLAVLIFAAIIRLRYLFVDTVWPDEALYVWYGHSILTSPSYLFSEEFTHTISYFPSIVIAFFDIFTSSFIAGRLMTFTFAIIGIILVYLIGKELGNEIIGLIGAILLTFSIGHWFNTSRILLDLPLTTMFSFVIYSLIKYEKNNKKSWFYTLIIASVLTMYTKVTGILVLPLIGAYFLFSYRSKILELIKRKEVRLGVLLFIVLILPMLIINFVNFGGATVESPGRYVSSDDSGADIMQPTRDLLFNVGIYVLPISLIGILFAIYYRKKEHILMILWIIIIYGFFTFLHPQTVDRYLLIVAPAFFILAGLALSEIVIIVNKKVNVKILDTIVIIAVILLMIPSYVQGNNLIKDKSYSYIGFKEAGDWLNNNAEKDAAIITSSTRALRIFTGRDFELYGGSLYGPAGTKEEFERQLEDIGKPVYFLIDQWEYIQPSWFYPVTEEKLVYLESLGFQLVYFVERELPTDKGLQKFPVVAIFKLS